MDSYDVLCKEKSSFLTVDIHHYLDSPLQFKNEMKLHLDYQEYMQLLYISL